MCLRKVNVYEWRAGTIYAIWWETGTLLVHWHTTSLVGHGSFAISILTQATTLVLIWGCIKKGGRNEGFILNNLGIQYFLRQFCEDILAEWAHLFRLPDSGPWDFCCFVGQNKRRNLQICNINTHATQNWNLKRKSLSLQPQQGHNLCKYLTAV